jgi:hypothetical protein
MSWCYIRYFSKKGTDTEAHLQKRHRSSILPRCCARSDDIDLQVDTAAEAQIARVCRVLRNQRPNIAASTHRRWWAGNPSCSIACRKESERRSLGKWYEDVEEYMVRSTR